MTRGGKLPVLNLLTGRKSAFSPRRLTRCTDSREIWHNRGASGSAWPCNISRQSVHRGGNAATKMAKMHFLVKSRPAFLQFSLVQFAKINVVLSAKQDHDTVISVIDAVVAGKKCLQESQE